MITAIATLLMGDVLGKNFDYKIGDEHFVGYAAKVAKFKPNAPVVYVVQDWTGVDAHEEEVVEKLAHSGFNAFAIDIYGKGVRPHDVKSCSGESGKYYANPELYMKRIEGGMAAFPTKGKKFLIGYCFGGTGVLEFARRNLGATGVISIHGGLNRLSKEPAKKINSKVVILHGAIDPFVSKADLESTKAEMKAAAKSYKFVAYPGAVHAFSVKDMGFKVDGAKYNENADKKSWIEVLKFLMANG
jgi:dienelactone hydrolase